ncbi:MAG TPA: radical SAM family heme chaperone HemW [Caulobacteraceae bacterium]|nr:radical SAM family heme chaperone HemW [Caulobacteraceae bacterium]
MSELAPLGLYVHWPYCARICPYCDFNVALDRRAGEAEALFEAILADLQAQAEAAGPHRLVSVFLGGGTPSLMRPEWAAGVVGAARALWPASADLEVTLEANPTDAEAERFAAFAEAGVNRLSLGVQALDDGALAFLGRNHSADEAVRAARLAARTFPRLSLDLIYARPGQTEAGWAEELKGALDLGPEHLSPYQLTIEPGTAFDRAVNRGAFAPADPDLAARLYETTQSVLEAEGFEAYEVSNHARGEAARSRHNLVYWRGQDYLGVGPGAHGRITTAGVRTATEAVRAIPDYLARVRDTGTGLALAESLSPKGAAEERLLMGLRTVEGVPLAELQPLPLSKLADLAQARFVRVADGRLYATAQGRPVLDRVIRELAD